MPGPIIRSGPSTDYQKNWNAAFGEPESNKSSAKQTKKKAARKKTKKK